MDSKKKKPNSIAEEAKETQVNNDSSDNVKVIQWEDYEQELARLCSLTSALEEAKQKKLLLQEKLQSLIEVNFFFLIVNILVGEYSGMSVRMGWGTFLREVLIRIGVEKEAHIGFLQVLVRIFKDGILIY